MGKLQVGQKNDPASNISNSVFNIGDALNNVLLKQSLTANSIFKVEGHIGKIIIDKYLVGSTIEAGKNIAKLFIGASVINQSTIHIEGNLNFLKIKKSFTESTLNIGGHLGKGNFDNDVFDATFLIDSVGKIKVKDDLMNTRITITSDLTKLQTGDARNLSLRIAGSLGNLTVKRSLDASLISVLNDIGTIRVGGDLNHTNLIGGIDVGGDFLLGTADDVKSGETMIHNIFVRGDMIDSSIAAGINPNGLYFGDGDDTAINNHLGTARIERVIIKGEIINTGLLGESYAITADDGIDLILSALLRPDGFPLPALSEAGWLVAMACDKGNRLLGDQVGDQLGEVCIDPTCKQPSGFQELVVPPKSVRQPGRRGELRVRPELTEFQAIKEPGPERRLLQVVPFVPVPTTLVLGSLEESDRTARRDELDPPL
ncbi:MAG: hypothetical protein IIB54_16105, partial [Planctomycetes bacterium]|nr:hypothetical protein [Planctomycetota bacterium]